MEPNNIDFMFSKKKKKQTVFERFHQEKEKRIFDEKKDAAIIMVQRFCRSFISNKHVFESLTTASKPSPNGGPVVKVTDMFCK